MPAKNTPATVPTWLGLNDQLRECSEAFAVQLLAKSKKGKWPKNFQVRIQKRYNRLRRLREMEEIVGMVGRD